MKACGLIVEYNPFHYGHLYHLKQSKQITSSDCMIAVMSGDFLQRGEPAIIDKFYRANAAIHSGIDLVVELPSVYAVQHSDIFAEGATKILDKLQTSSVCFGSEHGKIQSFTQAVEIFNENQSVFKKELHGKLKTGLSFPEASTHAYQLIGLTDGEVDLSQPNNILGFSYTKSIMNHQLSIEPLTIKRTSSNYHDQEINHQIASATSIRKELIKHNKLTPLAQSSLPSVTQAQLRRYKEITGLWHEWESYFPLLQYRVNTMSEMELRAIHGVEEGMEYRIKRTAQKALDFHSWMHALKTKRYTWTRLQRLFVHILTNTSKETISPWIENIEIPYIRILAMNDIGREYINYYKKQFDVPLITGFKKDMHPLLKLEEKAIDAYYSVLSPQNRMKVRKNEIVPSLLHMD